MRWAAEVLTRSARLSWCRSPSRAEMVEGAPTCNHTSSSSAAASADCTPPGRSARAPRPGHARRSPQLPPVPAASLPGGHRRPVARRHRIADPLDPATAAQPAGAAGAGARRRHRAPEAAARRRRTSWPTTTSIVAAGATHSYFGHDDWEELAPGLKTLDDALWRSAGGCCWPSSGPNGRRIRTSAPKLLTFVVVGGGPTGVELAGALAEIARHTLSNEFRAIEPGVGADRAHRGRRRTCWRRSTGPRQDASERALARLGVEVWKGKPVTADPEASSSSRTGACRAGTVLWAAGVRGVAARATPGRAARPRRPRARAARTSASPAIPRSSSSATSPSTCRTAGRCPAWRRWPCSRGAARRATSCARIEGRPGLRVPVPQLRRHGDHRPCGGRRGLRMAAPVGLGGVGRPGCFVHIMKLVGFRNRVGVLSQWAWAYFTYQRSVRLITDRVAGRDKVSGH